MLNTPMSATVTSRLTSAPRVNGRRRTSSTNAGLQHPQHGQAAEHHDELFGAASINPVKVGASRPNSTPKSPKVSAVVYWRSVLARRGHQRIVGPVRQELTAPTMALKNAPDPHAKAIVFTGAPCLAPSDTAVPWPFCTTSTVIASGTTSLTSAATDHTGACTTGWAKAKPPSAPPSCTTERTDHERAHQQGADDRRHALPQGRAGRQQQEGDDHRRGDRHVAAERAHDVEPKRRKTPATMPITIGIGGADITRRTRPLAPIAPPPAGWWREGADDLGEAQVLQRADQYGAGDGPREAERHVVAPGSSPA